MGASTELPLSLESVERKVISGASSYEADRTSSGGCDGACNEARNICTRAHARGRDIERSGGPVYVERRDASGGGRGGGEKQDNGDGASCGADGSSTERDEESGNGGDGESDLEGGSVRACLSRGEALCEWTAFGKDLLDSGEEMLPKDGNKENSIRRKALCRLCARKKYGHLGKGNRAPIPRCLQDRIGGKWPEANSELRMGFREN